MKRLLVVNFTLLLAVLVVGCAAADETTGRPQAGNPPAAAPTPSPAPTLSTSPVVEKARATLARQLGVDPSQLALVALEPVTWPDGSLGCPERGKLYTQATVPGFRAVFVYNGQQRGAHTNEDGSLVVLCTSATAPRESTY